MGDRPLVHTRFLVTGLAALLAFAGIGYTQPRTKKRGRIPTKIRMVLPRRGAQPAKREAYLPTNVSLLAYSDRPVEQNRISLLGPSSEQKGILLFQARPSWQTQSGKFYSENLLEGGFQFNKNFSLSYRQEFGHNVDGGLVKYENGFRLADGLVRAQINNIFAGNNWSFNYEPRLYFATDEDKRDQGMIVAIRNYIKVTYSGEKANFHIWEVPIFHQYSVTGFTSDSETGPKDNANPFFENRVYFIGEFGKGTKWNLWFPFMIRSVRFSDYSLETTNNDSWTYLMEIYPELMFQFSPNVSAGVGYESGNFLNDGLLDLGNAFQTGNFQLIFQLSM